MAEQSLSLWDKLLPASVRTVYGTFQLVMIMSAMGELPRNGPLDADLRQPGDQTVFAQTYLVRGVQEHVSVRQLHFNAQTLGAIAYVSIFPSVLAYICFNRGVELIGANRAGVTLHLVPLFGAILAIALLGEAPRITHLIGFALILTGVILAVRKG